MTESEAYLDIVWRQFKKNRFALVALWILAPLFLTAIFAPLIASDQPLVFREDGRTLYPWFRALFNPEEGVDFAFNMALIGFFPWMAIALACNWLWKRKGVPGRKRVSRIAVIYVSIIAVLIVAFSIPSFAGDEEQSSRYLLRPDNRYRDRTFREEEFKDPEKGRGTYVLIPFGPTEQDLDGIFQPPLWRKPPGERADANDGAMHVLGTDNTGSDVLVRMIYGTRISLTVGFVAVGIYITIGVVIGAVAGYFGGAVDILVSRIIEIVLLFPSFFLILTLVALIGPSIYIIMVVIGLTGWPRVARLIRGEVLKQRAIDYVAAARAMGSSHPRIIFRHILPNAISPALVAAPFGIAGAIGPKLGYAVAAGQCKLHLLVAGRHSFAGHVLHRHRVQPRGQRAARRHGPQAEELRQL